MKQGKLKTRQMSSVILNQFNIFILVIRRTYFAVKLTIKVPPSIRLKRVLYYFNSKTNFISYGFNPFFTEMKVSV